MRPRPVWRCARHRSVPHWPWAGGGATRPGGDEGGLAAGHAGDAVDAGGLDGLGQGHIRQDGGEAARQPRRAGSKGPSRSTPCLLGQRLFCACRRACDTVAAAGERLPRGCRRTTARLYPGSFPAAPCRNPPWRTLPHRRCGSSPVSSIAARLDLDEFPVEKGKDIDEPGRTKAIGPHTLGDHSRQVPRDVPVWVIDWFQDDFDGVVHLGQRAADDLHLPSTIAQGDESPVALEGAGDPRRADDDGRQHHHGHLDVRQRPAPVSGCQRYPDGGAPWLWWPSPRSCLLM